MRMSIDSDCQKRGAASFLLYICIFMVIVAVLFVWLNIKVRPFIISVARGYATNIVSQTLNEIMDGEMKAGDYSFIHLIEDKEGKIAAATMNSPDVNLLMTKIAIGFQNRIEDMDQVKADIPLGNFLPYPFLAGLGPEIPVRFVVLSNTSVTAEERFEAKGINQTLYTVSFHVVTSVGIYIPTMHESVVVENDIPVAKTLIVGAVPDSYTNVEGMEGSVQDTILDVD